MHASYTCTGLLITHAVESEVGMNVIQQLKLGFRSLMLHKLRSALAVLGILIGVTAVIWLVAMGEGVSYQAQQQIKELGATSIIVHDQAIGESK